ncbi:MAG: filamentous hemagglutinin family protein [Pseudomonadota bacterium]
MPPRTKVSSSRRLHAWLHASVSVLALATASVPASVPARALPLGTMRGGGSALATANAAAAAIAAVQQAQQASQQSMNNLTRAVQAVQAMQQAQAAARALARPSYVTSVSGVPNGLAPGGLQVAPAVPTDPSLWQNAGLPSQSTANGQTMVTIQQTAPKAILTWQTFNVGAQTTVYFNQSAGTQTNGNNNWIALNRIIDPSGVPSQILGEIKAEGSVYLINANGIIFGGGSQVNVHTLVASSLGFLGENLTGLTPGGTAYDAAVSATNALYLNATAGGIAAPEATGASTSSGKGNLVLGVGGLVNEGTASGFVTPGAVVVEPGASIATKANGSQSDGGFVLIAAPHVVNEGAITTPDGQAILAAGIGVSLLQPVSGGSSQLLIPELTGVVDVSGQDVTPVGTLINNGLVAATTGNVTLLGTNVRQSGIVEVTTSVSTPGSITISTVDEAETSDVSPGTPADRRAGQLNISGVIANLPEDDGQSVPSDSATFTAGTLSLTGGSVWLENGSLIEAPGASVAITALTPAEAGDVAPPGDKAVQGRVYLDNGATVDVAGIADVELPMSDTLVPIGTKTGLNANDLADAPLQRNSFLLGQAIVIDSTISGVSADGQAWVGTPLVDAAGYVALVPRTIRQLLTNAGSITLSGNQVMTASGSSLNLDGGYIHYLGGMVATTRLMDASGNLVNIANADPEDTYVGIAGSFKASHNIDGQPDAALTQYFATPLLSGAYYEPDYIQGGNAGTLSVFGTQAAVLDGAMTAAAFPGLKQMQAGIAPSGTSPGGNFLPEGGSFLLGAATVSTAGSSNYTLGGETGSVIIQDYAPSLDNLAPGFGADTPLNTAALTALGANDPDNVLAWTTVPAVSLSTGGFQNVSVTLDKIQGRDIEVAAGTTLAVQPGGSITLKSEGAVDIEGNLIAPAGTISVSVNGVGGGDITLGAGATLSVAGEWVNDGQVGDLTAGDTNFINAGKITLSTGDAASSGSSGNGVDATGSIVLEQGSLIDLASGGVMLPGGLLAKNTIPQGKAGSLSLLTYYDPTQDFFGDTADGGAALPTAGQPTAGQIVMDGTIDSFGFAGGGTLTLQALGFQIGGDPAAAPTWDLYLPASFFASQGFGSYQLNALYDTAVAPGTVIRLTQQNLIPNVAALAQLQTGGDLTAPGLTTLGTLDAYDRQATNLTLTAGGYLLWSFHTQSGGSDTRPTYAGVTGGVTIGQGAAILADAGAQVGLGSQAQVTELGTIVAPGGSITLSADDANGNGYLLPGETALTYGSASKSVWLGADALLDVAGVALVNPNAGPVRLATSTGEPVIGKVLGGGTVTFSDDSGYVVAEAGSVIDISGTSASFDEAQATNTLGTTSVTYAPQPVWSNAGSITLAAAGGLYFNATLKAQGGAPQADGGMLTLLPEVQGNGSSLPSARAIIFEAASNQLPAGLAPGVNFPTDSNNKLIPNGNLVFSTQELAGSGIGTLVVGGALNASGSQEPLVPVVFAGNVDLSLGRAIELNTPELVAIDAAELANVLNDSTSIATLATTAGTTSLGAPTVTLSAPYVAIAGAGSLQGPVAAINTTAALGDATLDVTAGFLDLNNQVSLQNFGQANFTSSGDIRLASTSIGSSGASLAPGALYTPGNLTFTAADIYPASGESFILDASGPQPTTITFQSNGTSQVPLSAGGSLLVDATNIVQAGTLRAPSGAIVLGVGDKTVSATQTAFASLPLTNTQSVTLASGSTTSVSLDGSSIPYGSTTDGLDWQYNAVATDTTPVDLSAPPAKVINLNGANVTLASGATVDLSGGGDLYATEWVPGTGGSRNVLSQYNVTYPASGAAVATPLFPDARNVYAIVPSYEAPVAAYDPVYAQVTQPATNANGTPTTQTETTGVGQAALNAQVGQAVYLSGVPGLPSGTYVLLPAKYATLPGAYRVVENTGVSNVVPGQSVTLPDGTHIVSGYYVDALSGARSATPVQFSVQPASVWEQYSQYTLTSANAYFASQARNNGTAVPPLPVDAGQLAIAASQTLILDATLRTAAGPGGVAAEVDIAAQDIEIVGQGEQALAGYLQLSADSLDQLGAGSLLIGGTRTATSSGISIDAIANSVVVANDANDPLTGPEILLVTKTDPAGDDPNAKNGLLIDSGSVIAARGSRPASADAPITFGSSTVSGDGALLRVSNAGQVTITRNDLPANAIGSLTVEAGANINGGAALTLDSSGTLNFAPSANFSGTNIAVDAPAITLTNATGAALAGLSGFVVGPQNLGQFASAQQVDLRSYGSILFDGNVDLAFGQNVELSAGSFVGNGGTVTISAPTIAFTNDLGATEGTATAGAASLNVNANEIDLGQGSKALAGFGAVAFNANGGIVGQNTGAFDMGFANVTLAAPVYLADTSSQTSLTTTGALALNGNQGTALARNPVGGAISFTGGTLAVNGAAIEAPAGNVTLEAKTGDLSIANGSLVSSQGVAKRFFDVVEYAPAGTISLTADTGSIDIASGSVLNFAGASGGGAAGKLTLSAPDGTVALNGTILGNAASGYQGGSFALNTGGAADLDNLAVELAQSGVTQSINVQTNAGNLILSAGNSLTALNVALTANGGAGGLNPNAGNIVINGTINASGNAGGTIDLYGKSGVDLEGALIATGSSATEQGGTVTVGTMGIADGTYNATYGYENISSAQDGQNNYLYSGKITLGANSVIDVGGTAGGLSQGTVNFRAPLLDNGDVNIEVKSHAQIIGSRATTLEAYAVWSTDDQTSGAQHFDGIVDPAGWYTSNGTLESGTFTVPSTSSTPPTFTFTPDANGDGGGTVTSSVTGQTTALTQQQVETGDSTIGFGGLQSDYYAPGAGADTAHQVFYGYQSDGKTPGTLMGFIENLPIAANVASRFTNAGVQNFAAAPGIELDNPDANINSGNISILSNWNLGAGTPNNNATIDPVYRYLGSIAPHITFRATGNYVADASITDGFFQSQIANILGAAGSSGPTGTYAAASTLYEQLIGADNPATVTVQFTDGTTQSLTSIDPNTTLAVPLLGQAAAYYSDYLLYANAWGNDISDWAGSQYAFKILPVTAPTTPAPVLANYASYQAYLIAYYGPKLTASESSNGGWLFGYNRFTVNGFRTIYKKFGTPTPPEFSGNPGDYPQYIQIYDGYLYQLTQTSGYILTTPPGDYSVWYAPLAPISIPYTGVNIGNLAGNAPANVPTANNPLPISFASLLGGQSSSYRIVAGADFGSANPLGLQPVATAASNGSGNVVLNGHFAYVDSNGQTLSDPTTIRTGTGTIDVAAASDVSLLDTTAPGVIYTAGAPSADAPAVVGSSLLNGKTGFGAYDVLAINAVNPDGAGDISIVAQGDITGIENPAAIKSSATQFWWPWLETGNVANKSGTVTQSSINFGAFDQGIMSVGGNVVISAGGNITNLAVSLPTTWYLSSGVPVTVGGGNLTVNAGGDILSGDYFVAEGTGTLSAGGLIGSSGLTQAPQYLGQPATEVSTILALQDGVFDVSARQGADIGAMVDPSYLQGNTLVDGYGLRADAQSYSARSALNVVSTTGAVSLNTLLDPSLLGAGKENALNDGGYVLPASVELAAFSGGINIEQNGELYPSAIGELSLIAAQSVDLYNANSTSAFSANYFGLIDASTSVLPSPLNPMPTSVNGVTNEFDGQLSSSNPVDHSQTALHAGDTQPVRIYSLTGSINDGILASKGNYNNLLQIVVDKPAEIEAGQDIFNLAFSGQNLRDDDLTSIIAGRDIYDSKNFAYSGNFIAPALLIGGPGNFLVEAGRNIGPFLNAQDIYNTGSYNNQATGIDAIGNALDPFLPHESANVNVLFGTGPGIDTSAFVNAYIAPTASIPGIDTTSALIAFVEQYDDGEGIDTGLVNDRPQVTLSFAQAWAQFQALPQNIQQLFAQQELFQILQTVDVDYNNSASPYYQQYARGYAAINTLFPAAYGYTANSLDGGTNGANQLVSTGNLDIRSTTIQTQQGGNITILGPGGHALVGSESAPPVIANSTGKVVVGPGVEGILTLEQGNIDVFLDQSLLLAQSRVFTEQGGDEVIWSSNGDINAGKGAKTLADVPPPVYVSDENHYNTRDARGEVTGAGIATLQSLPGVPTGNAYLIAPRGTIDAGAAGIRVSGNLALAALYVVNANNIQVQGTAIGVPTAAAPNVGALDNASAASGAATKAIVAAPANNAGAQPSILIVEIEGYGGDDGAPAQQPRPGQPDNQKKHEGLNGSLSPYSTTSAVQVLGSGQLTHDEDRYLTAAEKQRLAQP